MASKDEELVLFTRSDSDEILKFVFNEPSGNPHPAMRSYGDAEVVLAYTTAGATARSGTTLGTGTATSRWIDASGSTRNINSTTDAITFYNLATTTVGTNKYILLCRLGADWICIWEQCG
jgi:hypothetical protein